ncbi:hypothetical protein LTR17_026188 [Elasticomyces elasticus]|nr:hypothetical protein LTR17_026188 [Elasticomyces elasticus]
MQVPKFFKAAVVDEARARNVIRDRSLGPVKSGEVSIKITATAINPVDWKMRDHNKFIHEYPAILGSDAAGIIVSAGPNVSGFATGDRVFFQGIIGKYESSTFQEYCKMPAALVSLTPSIISDEQAAGISLATMAVVVAFYDAKGHGMTPPWDKGGQQVGKGKAMVITGGSSSVGQYAIQMARLSGFERIITNASTTHHEHLKELGAHIVLDRAHSGPDDFKAAIGDWSLEFVFDAISVKATQVLGVKILQATKTANSPLVTVHVVDPDRVDPDAEELGQSKEPKIDIKQVLGLGSDPAFRYLSEPLAKCLGGKEGYIAKGLFTPNRPRVVSSGLSAIEEALALHKKGVSGEKVVIRPFDMAK